MSTLWEDWNGLRSHPSLNSTSKKPPDSAAATPVHSEDGMAQIGVPRHGMLGNAGPTTSLTRHWRTAAASAHAFFLWKKCRRASSAAAPLLSVVGFAGRLNLPTVLAGASAALSSSSLPSFCLRSGEGRAWRSCRPGSCPATVSSPTGGFLAGGLARSARRRLRQANG